MILIHTNHRDQQFPLLCQTDQSETVLGPCDRHNWDSRILFFQDVTASKTNRVIKDRTPCFMLSDLDLHWPQHCMAV